ncbi:hypothetical protein [Gordonia soli]|nr:hypothetical protein [Gordonia soli]
MIDEYHPFSHRSEVAPETADLANITVEFSDLPDSAKSATRDADA